MLEGVLAIEGEATARGELVVFLLGLITGSGTGAIQGDPFEEAVDGSSRLAASFCQSLRCPPCIDLYRSFRNQYHMNGVCCLLAFESWA